MLDMRANRVLIELRCTNVTAGALTRKQLFARVHSLDT